MLAPSQPAAELALPALDLRAWARRAVVPAAVAGAAVGAVLLAGGPLHEFAAALRRVSGASPAWLAIALVFECISLAGYVALLSLVAGDATPRVGARESAQITLAGAAATRLLPTAGAGGAGLTIWALRRAGLRVPSAMRTLLTFLVLLYAVFLGSIAVSGSLLTVGVVGNHGPRALSGLSSALALAAIALCLVLAGAHSRRRRGHHARGGRMERVRDAGWLLGDAVCDALRVARSGDPRLAGAVAYWMFDAAVLWAMLHTFGSPPSLAVVALAYLVGQVANTLPIPGSVSGGMAAVLIAFGTPVGLALPSVLAYRTIAVWLPLPAAIASLPGLRTTVERWAREDAAGQTTA